MIWRVVKKPFLVSAVKWDGHNQREIKRFTTGKAFFINSILHIRTKEGLMTLRKGGWVIEGVEGEFYPIMDRIFRKTYTKKYEYRV